MSCSQEGGVLHDAQSRHEQSWRGSHSAVMSSDRATGIPKAVPVSVIIPCYRSEATITRAIESVLGQLRPPVEIIVVDDGSGAQTCNALDQICALPGTARINLIRAEQNRGPGAARNTGWSAATQPYVAFLDADDSWHPRKLEIQYDWMQLHPDAYLTGHPCNYHGSPKPERVLPDRWTVRRVHGGALLLSNSFITSSVMARRDLPFRFKDAKRYSEDYLLWLQTALSGLLAYRLELELGYQYKAPYGQGGLSKQLWSMELGELDAYQQLRAAGLISGLSCKLLAFYSAAKFLRRLVKVPFLEKA